MIKTLPYVFANQMGDDWISRQQDSAKLMKDYLISSGALKGELKSFDDGISKLLKKS